jgi:ferric-dicitrate binding protein FerR (iron transport regulator)
VDRIDRTTRVRVGRQDYLRKQRAKGLAPPASDDAADDAWHSGALNGVPVELCTAVATCRAGVGRVHLVDSSIDGVCTSYKSQMQNADTLAPR